MDQVHFGCHSWIIHLHHGSPSAVRLDRAAAQFLKTLSRYRSSLVGRCHILFRLVGFPGHMSTTRLRVEIVWSRCGYGLTLSAIGEHIIPRRTISYKRYRSLTFPTIDRARSSESRSRDSDLCPRFQKAIKKVRATQRMRRQRGFAFSQTETANQDQTRLIRSYDTSQARPSGY